MAKVPSPDDRSAHGDRAANGEWYTPGQRPPAAPRPSPQSPSPSAATAHYTPGRRPTIDRAKPIVCDEPWSIPAGLGGVGPHGGFHEASTKGQPVVLYLHGIGNKPPASTLKCQWDVRLFESRLGQRTRMAYWVNRVRYPDPLKASCESPDFSDLGIAEAGYQFKGKSSDRESGWDENRDIPLSESDAAEGKEFLRQVRARIEQGAAAEAPSAGRAAESVGRRPAMQPGLVERICRSVLPDVHDYFFDQPQRERIDKAVSDRMLAGNRYVIVAHSLGTVIAYRILAMLQARSPQLEIPLLITVGSPLGMPEVQRQLRSLLGTRELPVLTCVKHWLNVADELDPVAIGARLGGSYGCDGPLDDILKAGLNPDGPRHPHSATGYLSIPRVRARVRDLLGTEFAEEISSFTIARDVADWVEDAREDARKEVLIELQPDADGNIEPSRQKLRQYLNKLLDGRLDKYCVMLTRYLAVQLTPREIELLGQTLGDERWGRVWQDAVKSSCINRSAETVHAPAAWRSYQSFGQGIHWAVLDTGIRPDHPHFATERNVASVWDCTQQTAEPTENRSRRVDGPGIDWNGHGTHVAGVIAGRFPSDQPLPAHGEPFGIAPQAKLHSYKVLADSGHGRDSWIIKALQHIEERNRRSRSLVIHGVNLSLGGDFDPEVYSCGHSPLCNELRRLWRQGVVIVTSAGNLGNLTVESAGRSVRLNLDLSIGDPANLEEAISVGSVHKTDARRFGISYFSSRGPTADGRRKPDVVAPGEKILSARAKFHDHRRATLDALESHYVEMSGTSMAAPHVSGVLAAFLSQRQGFLGNPDGLRQVLIDNCTDLGRDRYHQGAGVPNLTKMLLTANS